MAYSRRWIEELNSRIDIVQLVSEHVQLKKNGANYIGLCPFHHEKTASFNVNPALNVYHCFGCKAGGDAIRFVMDINHMTFQEAIEYLADRYNLKMPEQREDPGYDERKKQSERLYEVNKEAARHYHRLLWTDHGKPILNYFYSRGLSDQVIRKFGLGASTSDRHLISDHLSSLGFSDKEMTEAGIIVNKDGYHRDMFISRALFPIIDIYGRVLGFGGRATEPETKPKYLNTADTLVFNKRKGVFAANQLKKQNHLNRIILVEGYLDVISLTQFGVQGVVATLGTALTLEQVRLMKRFAPEIWLAYDGDEAGQHAIERGIDLCRQENVPAKVLFFPDGQDPDEFIRSHGKEAFDQLVPLKAMAYQMMRVEKRCSMGTEDGRLEYAKDACELLRTVRDPIDLEYYQKIVSQKSGFSLETIKSQFQTEASQKPQSRQPIHNNRKHEDSESDVIRSEKTLIALLAMGVLPAGGVKPEDFVHPVFIDAAKQLIAGKTAAEVLGDLESDAERQQIAEATVMITQEELNDPAVTAGDCLRILRKDRLEKELIVYREKLQQENDENARKYIMKKIIELRRLIANPANP